MGRFLSPAVGGILVLLALLGHAHGQSEPAAGGGAGAKTSFRILAVSMPPFVQESLPEGGLVLELIATSLRQAAGGAAVDVRWTDDALTPQALKDPSVDFSLPVESADCDRPNDLAQSSAMLCDNAVASEPILQVILALFSLSNGSFKFDADDNILGKTVCLSRDNHVSALNAGGRNWAAYKRVNVLRRAALLDCVAAVQAHDADALVTTDLEGTYLLRRLGLTQFYTMHARPLATRGLHAVVARDHARGSELIATINDGLRRLKGGVAYSTIVQQHLAAAAAPPTPAPTPAPVRPKDTPAAAAVAQPPKVAAPPPVLDPARRASALKFVKRGHEELADGRIAPARLLYERAAEMGLAQAAMALAATYDPAELNQPHLRNVQPDLAEAKRWYERARDLGAAEAGTRLQRLGAK
jgi:hypothetical protein